MTNEATSTLSRSLSALGKLLVGTRKGPSGDRVRRLKKLEKRIGVKFTDLSLLEQALTHRSYSHVTSQTRNDSNERMEFLGDSVLGLAVSQFLYLEFPDRSEGALSKMKSLLVSRNVLSSVSRNVGIGEYLLLSGEESDMGGRDRTSILADSFEGLIGAIYLDQGFREANRFVRRFLMSEINTILKDEEHTNYKSLLQEYVQSKRLSHPVYRVRREEGPEHEKEFAVDVIVRGETWGSGRGKSKKEAEQYAARAALERRKGKAATREAVPRPEGARRVRPEPREGRAEVRRGERGDRSPTPRAPRPAGEHGVAASRERLRSQRDEERGEVRRSQREERRRPAPRAETGAASAAPPERERVSAASAPDTRRPSRRGRRRRGHREGEADRPLPETPDRPEESVSAAPSPPRVEPAPEPPELAPVAVARDFAPPPPPAPPEPRPARVEPPAPVAEAQPEHTPEASEASDEPVSSSTTGDSFARRRKRMVRGFRKR
jgi:ribonuclease-3